MNILGLLFELFFLAMGVYLYLFATGRLRVGDANARKKADAFREKNGWWLRLGGLALVAIMAINIFIHLQQIFG